MVSHLPDRTSAVKRRGGWFADVYLEELTAEQSIHAEVRLRAPDGEVLCSVGTSRRDPHDRHGSRPPMLAIARALKSMVRQLDAQSDGNGRRDLRTLPQDVGEGGGATAGSRHVHGDGSAKAATDPHCRTPEM
jgi:hypothetical protein